MLVARETLTHISEKHEYNKQEINIKREFTLMSRKRFRARNPDLIARGNNFVNQRTSDPNFLKSTNAVSLRSRHYFWKREVRGKMCSGEKNAGTGE